MRKIQTQSEIERKRKRNMMIMSFLMLGVLVLSTLGFAFLTAPGQDLNNVEDELEPQFGDKLRIEYSGQSFYLLNSKADIENIDVNIIVLPVDYTGKILYVSVDNQGILQELASSLGRFSSRFQEACYGPCEKNLPEKNCTGSDNLIVWQESEENKVYQEDKCVFINGDIRAVDAFIYELFK